MSSDFTISEGFIIDVLGSEVYESMDFRGGSENWYFDKLYPYDGGYITGSLTRGEFSVVHGAKIEDIEGYIDGLLNLDARRNFLKARGYEGKFDGSEPITVDYEIPLKSLDDVNTLLKTINSEELKRAGHHSISLLYKNLRRICRSKE